MIRNSIAAVITVYQKTISPDHGLFRARFPYGYCRFYPSCSEYTKQSILTFGVLKGMSLGVMRIIKCNPFAKPRIDLPN